MNKNKNKRRKKIMQKYKYNSYSRIEIFIGSNKCYRKKKICKLINLRNCHIGIMD